MKDTDSSSSVASSANELNNSLETGYNASVTLGAKVGFAGSGVSTEGTAGMHGTSQSAGALKQSIQSEVSSAASVGTTTTHHTTCAPKAGETRAGLWQWILSSEDFSVQAFTPHTICRSGDLAFVEPTCSYWDCDNADCTACKKPVYDPKTDILKDSEKQQDAQ